MIRKNIIGKLCNELTIPSIEESHMHSIATACTTIQAYPGIEQDVHQDSVLFGIPVANLPNMHNATNSNQTNATVPAVAGTPPVAPAIPTPLPVAMPPIDTRKTPEPTEQSA